MKQKTEEEAAAQKNVDSEKPIDDTQKPEKDVKEKVKKPKKIKIDEAEYATLLDAAAELKDTKESLLRVAADFENAKKRNDRQKDEFLSYANKKIIGEVLPIVDNLTRALDSAKTNQSVESLIEGVEMISKQLWDVLKEHGLVAIDALHKPFDPHKHEAIGSVETDEFDDETVVEEIAKGYEYKETLLRPAMVRISSHPHPPQPEADDADDETVEE